MSSHDDEILGKEYDSRLMRRLMTYLRPYRGRAVLALLAIVAGVAAQLAQPVLVKRAIDDYIATGDLGGLEGLGQFWRGIAAYQQTVVALVDKAGAAAGDIHYLADQVRIDLLHEVFEVQIEVVDATAQLGRVVIAQVFRV